MTLQIEAGDVELLAEASSADDAIEAWRRHQPDVLVLDYLMPGRDGVELAAEILAEDPTQAVVLVSAFLEPQVEARARRVGVRECLSKELLADLAAVIHRHCPEAA